MANATKKEQALHRFWSSFDLTAHDESTVPTGDNAPSFPYITYNVVTDSIGDPVALTASVWYRSSSWADVTEKAESIGKEIGLGGKLIPYDNGALWIKRGTPFAQRMADESDDMVRRIYLNIEAEFISAD